ncbi:hypothetical protein MCM1_1195 [Methanosarcina barkeri CM1]|uniref:Uncharacterized protein n=1 Tax=Methanosarcina barkeri CM1 TaxID=796385 RepID=A0A0G3C8E2_METBA|nr:hypothetical protein MCM1_1195 [Methanosarcina barkeri CM1]
MISANISASIETIRMMINNANACTNTRIEIRSERPQADTWYYMAYTTYQNTQYTFAIHYHPDDGTLHAKEDSATHPGQNVPIPAGNTWVRRLCDASPSFRIREC